MTTSNVQLFVSADGLSRLEVALDHDTVWLSQTQMAALFDKDIRTVGEHIKNIYSEKELDKDSTLRNFRRVRQEGDREVTRNIDHYNLDVIISVGYRVKSQRGVQFRQWATRTLKSHLVQGYTLNQRRLIERGIEFDQVVDLLSRTLNNQGLVSPQGAAVAAVISDYARSWSLLQGYDEQALPKVDLKQHGMLPLGPAEALTTIADLRQALISKGEATELFGQLRGSGLASALGTIEQGFGDELFYPNIASRAAHLLYFVIKNHPLADGNKRCGSFLFLWYLRRNQAFGTTSRTTDQRQHTLVALALLVAESLPAQKTLMIRLIEHFITLPNSGDD